MKIGEWVCVGEDGLRWSRVSDSVSYATKREAIADIRDAYMDPRKRPKVRRLGPGYYTYEPKDIDDGGYYEQFEIILLTPKNIGKYKEMYARQEAEGEE